MRSKYSYFISHKQHSWGIAYLTEDFKCNICDLLFESIYKFLWFKDGGSSNIITHSKGCFKTLYLETAFTKFQLS